MSVNDYTDIRVVVIADIIGIKFPLPHLSYEHEQKKTGKIHLCNRSHVKGGLAKTIIASGISMWSGD